MMNTQRHGTGFPLARMNRPPINSAIRSSISVVTFAIPAPANVQSSWNNTKATTSITSFVQKVTTKEYGLHVPQRERTSSVPKYDRSLPFNVVYCQGIAHHTAPIWSSIANRYGRIAPGGSLVIAIYNDRQSVSRVRSDIF
jgi:hypothetical protein